MPTPDAYYYDPGNRPPPTPGTLITSGAVPGLITNRARGTPTDLARRLVAAGVNPPTEPPSNIPPPNPFPPDNPNAPAPGTGQVQRVTPAAYKPSEQPQPPEQQQQPAAPSFPGATSAPTPAQPPRGVWNPQPKPPTPSLTPPSLNTGVKPVTAYPQNPLFWGPAPMTPFQPQIQRYATEYGVPPQLLSLLVRAESNFNPYATGPMTKYGQARGVMQFIPQTASLYGIANPYSPDESIRGGAEYLRRLFEQKGSWAGAVAAYNGIKDGNIDASQYVKSADGRQLIAFAKALDGGKVAAGPLVPPPQNYRPVSFTPQGGTNWLVPDRQPGDLFTTKGLFGDQPGNMPHEREFGGIMRGLAPLLMIGLSLFTKGAALPMLSAFAGYQNARNKRQEKDAEEKKKQWRDYRDELLAKMQVEGIEEAGAMDDPQKLLEIAQKYSDQQLQDAVVSGGPAAAQKLIQLRDKAFQDLKKTQSSDYQAQRLELQTLMDASTLRQRDLENQYRQETRDDAKKRLQIQIDKEKEHQAQIKKEQDAQRAAGFENPDAGTGGSDKDEDGGDGEGGSTGEGTGGGEGATGGSDGGGTGEQGAATPPAAATPASASEDQPVSQPERDPNIREASFSGAPLAAAPGPTPAGAPPAAAAPAPAAPAADTGRIQTPGITPDSAADGFVSDITTGGSINDVPKEDRSLVANAAAWRKQHLQTLLNNSTLSGADFNRQIARIDPAVAGVVQRVADVDQGLPGGTGMGARLQPYSQMIAELVKKQRPDWDASMWKSKQDLREDFVKGWRSRTIYRANTLPSATVNVLKELNKVQALHPSDSDFQSRLQAMLDHTGTYKEYAGLASALRTFAIESTGAVSMGTPTVTLTEELIRNAMPTGENPAAIREALVQDIGNVSRGLDTIKNEWQANFHDPFSGVGYNEENDQTLKIIEKNLNVDTGAFVEPDTGMPITGGFSPTLQPAVPTAAQTAGQKGTHTDGDGWSIKPVQ